MVVKTFPTGSTGALISLRFSMAVCYTRYGHTEVKNCVGDSLGFYSTALNKNDEQKPSIC